MYTVYILHSQKLDRYYVGYSSNMEDRLRRHNTGQGKFTKKGIPWQVVKTYEFEIKKEAMVFERKIKNMGVKRFVRGKNLDRAS